MNNKEKFIEIYKSCITREGADKFLEYLCEKTDFFTAPASTRFHGAYDGGLLEHSLNVYECLCDQIKHSKFCSKYGFTFSEESLAIAALLHDVCKTNFYKTEMRNVKKNGVWESVPYYTIEDNLPYGHGEKSVYIISGFMRFSHAMNGCKCASASPQIRMRSAISGSSIPICSTQRNGRATQRRRA